MPVGVHSSEGLGISADICASSGGRRVRALFEKIKLKLIETGLGVHQPDSAVLGSFKMQTYLILLGLRHSRSKIYCRYGRRWDLGEVDV